MKIKSEKGLDIKLREYPAIELDDGKDPMFWFMVSIIAFQITVISLIISL